jgi:hypothetical protein
MILMSARSKTQPPTSGLAQGGVFIRRKFSRILKVFAPARTFAFPRPAPSRRPLAIILKGRTI